MSPRSRTILIAVCGSMVGLAIVVLLIARTVLTEARIRVAAASYVKAYTGRDLVIAGPIDLSFVPWLGAELRQVTLSGPPARVPAPPPAPVYLEELGLKVRLVPLIRGHIEVGGIHARGGKLSAAGYDFRDVDLTTGAFGDARTTDLSIKGTVAPAGSKSVPLSLGARMMVDIARQALELTEIRGSIGRLSFTGEVHGRQMMQAPLIDGRIATGTFDLRQLLTDLGTPYATADPKALTAVSLAARMAAAQMEIQLKDLVVSLDGSRFTGEATRTSTPRAEWHASVRADSLDLDRYVPGPVPVGHATAGGDYAALRDLLAETRVAVQRLKVYGLQLSNATAVVQVRNGVVSVVPARATAYGGSGELSARMDVRSNVPAYHMEGRLARVSVQPLLTAAQSISALAGTGDVSLRLDATGNETGHLTRSLSGQVALLVEDGHLEGADLLKLLTQAQALSDRLRGRPVTTSSNAADRTKFSRLSGSATIERGVARNRDLVISAPSLNATGEGTIDLTNQAIDYVLRATSREAGNVLVPIAIAGPFASPSYSVQTGALLKEAGRQELKKQLEKRGLGKLFKIPRG